MDGLVYDGVALPPIGPQETHPLSQRHGQVEGGRFVLLSWQAALTNLDTTKILYHMRTAGLVPDTAQPGLAGDPDSSANIEELSQYEGNVFQCTTSNRRLCLGFVAYAARYLPSAQLEYLLQHVVPTEPQKAYRVAVAGLPDVIRSIRIALERKGVDALRTIQVPHVWYKDRGLVHPVQFEAIGLTMPAGLMSPRVAKDQDGALGAIKSAYEGGHEIAAAHWALEAFRLRKTGSTLTHTNTILMCSGFDAGAAQTTKQDQFLASYSYLMLLSRLCPDTPGQRERFADWFSVQGRDAFADLRLVEAKVLFERAHFFDKGPKTEAQLADTLAELAILRFREGHLEHARSYLGDASRIAPYRPKVLAAQDADPGGNKRAKVGLIILICFMGFFVIRKLRRVWFGDLSKTR